MLELRHVGTRPDSATSSQPLSRHSVRNWRVLTWIEERTLRKRNNDRELEETRYAQPPRMRKEAGMDMGHPEEMAAFGVIVIIVEFAVLAAPTVILLQIICVRRAGGAESSVVLHQSSLIFSSIAGQQKFPLKLKPEFEVFNTDRHYVCWWISGRPWRNF
ncbi:hypothetical protein QQF64_026177 [Cirrhinus molitorella]|uniref:Uncharacterized protein n=1 Tax=Cirrhinus molitorella TaxID=172907 RepID=A0ABR3NRF1_9TELE